MFLKIIPSSRRTSLKKQTLLKHLKRPKLQRSQRPRNQPPFLRQLPLVSGRSARNFTDYRHEWYQTDQHVFVDIFFKNIPKDKCSVDIEPLSVFLLVSHLIKQLQVTFPLPTGSDFTFTLDPLFSTVTPES